ncbi:MAG TPA: hypothetical protein VN837_05455 [Chloroflexota bacterium]|nr:hypothetical protein [Chloroflexota bacterium]
MIALLLAIVAVSFAAGLAAGAIIAGVLIFDPAYQRGRAAALADRASRESVRRRLLALVVAPAPLPAARRDHADAQVLHLVRIGAKKR